MSVGGEKRMNLASGENCSGVHYLELASCALPIFNQICYENGEADSTGCWL